MAPRRVGIDRDRPESPSLHHHRRRTPTAGRRGTALVESHRGGRQSAPVRIGNAMSVLRRLWNNLRRNRMDADIQQELETHLALLEEEERSRGLTVSEARTRARSR